MWPKTIIVRHKRENLKKCSLRGLEKDPHLLFFSYPSNHLPPVHGYLLLSFDGPPLTLADQDKGLLFLDATWRRAAPMETWINSYYPLERRSLPTHFTTAYPRRQNDCLLPDRGLATVEALFIAHRLLGRPSEHLLDHYHWREPFLLANSFS